jgi:chemotaxis signal transduction protein
MRAIIPAMAGSAWFGLDALAVQEVLGERSWVRLPHASPCAPGVLAWRGRAVAVLDVSEFLRECEPLRVNVPRPRTLVVLAEACTFAIPVDSVRVVHEIGAPPPGPKEDGSGEPANLSDGVDESAIDAAALPVLDLVAIVERVLREAEAQ